MLSTHTIEGRGLPLWAIVAPLVGVPALVALLALAAPRHETSVHASAGIEVEAAASDHLSPEAPGRESPDT